MTTEGSFDERLFEQAILLEELFEFASTIFGQAAGGFPLSLALRKCPFLSTTSVAISSRRT